jgi:hypothetical protein
MKTLAQRLLQIFDELQAVFQPNRYHLDRVSSNRMLQLFLTPAPVQIPSQQDNQQLCDAQSRRLRK